uniref:Peptidyl-prolyl cis-trans isomerase n=1 Tax=Hippocampus comes TaxID=109280 RepID=A0A3Q2YQ78_HIPCM
MAVLLETTLGDIVIDLFTEERPKACLNFLKLCKIKYYNYCLIHNVQRDFIIQTGDPTGTGRGGESVFCKLYGDQARFFDSEKAPRIKHRKKGTVSMVNNGSDQHGSQFLITTGENLDYLDGVHTVFGEVSEGLDIVAKINETFVDTDFVPFQDIRINHTVILDDPFDDPLDLPVPDRSPEPTKEQLDSGRIGADETIDDADGKAAEEVEERLQEKEAKTRAILLEMVGDLPDADVKPPEDVLFVCKLNPVTTDEDLEIIFSRFGELHLLLTGTNGQEDCEKAYFKMDNVLIDDRRIHVDFSQSVSKIKWKGKGGKYTKEDFKAYENDLEKRSKLTLKDQAKPKQDHQELSSLLLHISECKCESPFPKFTFHLFSPAGLQIPTVPLVNPFSVLSSPQDDDGGRRDRKMDRQRSRSRDRERRHAKSRDKYVKGGRDRSRRSRSQSPRKSKVQDRSRYR